MSKLVFGVIGTSKKENELRMPIHPEHINRIPEQIRRRLIFEEGYGKPFDITDNEIASQTGGIATRRELLSDLGKVIISKPILTDFQELREGGTLWGWCHCVQQKDITQVAIDRKLTLIAFEEMFAWKHDRHVGRHTFHMNNEFAGYCAVLHALQLKGISGHYGNQRKALIFSFGAVSHGAMYALKAHGFKEITICTQRPSQEVREGALDCNFLSFRKGIEGEPRMIVVDHKGIKKPLLDLISEADIIVNGIFQDTEKPVNFITEEEISHLKPGSLIIDISCDENMGFPFAKPTTFDEPMFKIGSVDYYAVDHTPSYLWESATRLISEALVNFLPIVLAGRESRLKNKTIRRAVEIDSGVVQKSKILSFQKRKKQYPHKIISV